MTDGTAATWPRVLLVVLVLVVAFAALVVVLVREPDDRAVTGEVTSAEPHRICVAARDDGAPTCAHVDAPQRLHDIEPGDCVRVTVSADEQLVDVAPVAADGCR